MLLNVNLILIKNDGKLFAFAYTIAKIMPFYEIMMKRLNY